MGERLHLILPEELVAELDTFAGKRGRSKFIEAAVRDKLALARQRAALEAAKGMLADVDIPEWSTPEKTSAWVHESRRRDDAHTQEKIRRLRN